MFGNLDQCLATENIEIDLKEIFDPKMPPKGPAAGLGPPPIAKQMMDKFKTEPNTIDQLDKLHTEIGSAVRAMRKVPLGESQNPCPALPIIHGPLPNPRRWTA